MPPDTQISFQGVTEKKTVLIKISKQNKVLLILLLMALLILKKMLLF